MPAGEAPSGLLNDAPFTRRSGQASCIAQHPRLAHSILL